MARMLGRIWSGGHYCRGTPEFRKRAKRQEQWQLGRDLDDLVAEWHDAKPGSEAASVPLHEWLGMTWDEYGEWVAHP